MTTCTTCCQRRTVNTPLTDNLFTGQKQDESGLYYYNARYYDPEIGHFISPDTLVPDPGSVFGYNRYMYSLGNPLRFSDPSGHCPTVQPDLQDEEARAEHINCWDLAVKIYLMYDSDPFWQERFQIEREDWFVKIATMSGNDVAYMQNQMDAWYFDFTARVGLPHPDRHVEWHAPPPSAYNEAEILGLFRGEGLCDVWDCVAIGLDLASLGTQLARDTSLLSVPITGPAGVGGFTSGQAVQTTLTFGSAGWTRYQVSKNEANQADMTVSLITAGASYIPVAAEFSSAAQLMWDLFDPLMP
ncbi:MAG: RHS repeat-associated core domain-containing protein [Caldilineaceae bacterium]|nr:RHS repeat-associated core domain-containing protein [Caldilineaceae bacterium]